jgi:hypothetical protein
VGCSKEDLVHDVVAGEAKAGKVRCVRGKTYKNRGRKLK